MTGLDALKTDVDITEETDSIGGFSTLETGLYALRVKLAYITRSQGKAMALNLLFEGTKKEQLKIQLWMTSGEKKGCKNYYMGKKDNKKHYLPGFNQANALCLLTLGIEVSAIITEKKNIPLYDPAQQKNADTEVDWIPALIGAEIFAGVIKQIVDKTALNPDTNKYEPTGEVREENEIDKFFRIKDSLTVVEIRAKKTDPTFMTDWLQRWDGKTKDRTTKKAATAGAPARQTGKQAPTPSLFK